MHMRNVLSFLSVMSGYSWIILNSSMVSTVQISIHDCRVCSNHIEPPTLQCLFNNILVNITLLTFYCFDF